ncbi:SH3 domain-containing protein [Corallococcus sp. ZKHCc1 1396]|uniref:SH3 domain-containing protein n=1 Tax=Corallococcus soli TaxID=2710757 RepID=A0ABR9PYG7_9BACT|nr:SH3 domain-containing protein [Corallococcus soli]MBE4752797.1 SH3 domain-containing protein [Corallococcus soli]
MLSVLFASLLAQAPVTLPELTERHCSSSGWCIVLPAPLYPGLVAARGDAVVSNSAHSGVVGLWRSGAWRDTLDTGLGPLQRLSLADAPGGAQRLLACDRARCVQATLDAERIGPLSLVPQHAEPPEPPEPPVRSPRPGVRFFVEDSKLLVERGGQRQTPPALKGTRFANELDQVFGGGPGEPLWMFRTHVARLTLTEAHPLGRLDRFPKETSTNGIRLLGNPHEPTALSTEMFTHTLRRFDGERWQPLTTHLGSDGKDPTSVTAGDGCAPCFTSLWRILWRARSGVWRQVDLPSEPPGTTSIHHPQSESIDARGMLGFKSQYGAYRHDGRKWRRVGEATEAAKVAPVEARQDWLCNATGCLHEREPRWSPDGKEWRPLDLPPAEPGKGDCAHARAALSNGEFMLLAGPLLFRGIPGKGWHTERLPLGNACNITEGPTALYISDSLRKSLLIQQKAAAPLPVPEDTWATVSGVKASDVLRLRELPDWRALEVATLAPGTRCVREVRRRAVSARETWSEVQTPEGRRGWVNRRYLAPGRGPCPTGG